MRIDVEESFAVRIERLVAEGKIKEAATACLRAGVPYPACLTQALERLLSQS